jgi:serine/threonine protein kinase
MAQLSSGRLLQRYDDWVPNMRDARPSSTSGNDVELDPEDCVLTREYTPNGSLKGYLCAHNNKISMAQRLRWTAEGLQLSDSADVIHRDVEPKSPLLDADLVLKIADFSSSSLNGSQPSACVGTKFLQPNFNWRKPLTIQQDLFSFGSTIYNTMTWQAPFQELQSNEATELYKTNAFPSVTRILYREITEQCWHYEVASAQEIYDSMQIIEMKLLCEINIHRNSVNANLC